MFDNKVVLITGGTGSFGITFVKYLLSTSVSEIRIFSRDEKKQDDLRKRLNSLKLKFFIGDVRDISSLNLAIQGVDYVFSAAALKQVPSCEFYPLEAYKTNVLGADNLIQCALNARVKKIVFLSTDKAVYPINVMGMSKAMMEKVVQSYARIIPKDRCQFVITRYGNVVGSRGSVVPLFLQQIKEKKPITITDPSMTRFMMSLDESVKLVETAFKEGNSGDIFVKKSPAATVEDIAESLLKCYPDNNGKKIIGIRHGEKNYESLISKEEMLRSEDMGEFFRISIDDRDLNYSLYFDNGNTDNNVFYEYSSANTERMSIDEIESMFRKLKLLN